MHTKGFLHIPTIIGLVRVPLLCSLGTDVSDIYDGGEGTYHSIFCLKVSNCYRQKYGVHEEHMQLR